MFASANEIPEQPSQLAFAFVHEGVNSSEVSGWLALRASVLRRAASLSGTARERRAEISAVVSSGSRGVWPKWKSKRANNCPFSQLAQISRPQPSEPPRKPLALGRPCRSNSSCSPFGFFHSHQCWLTCRSTGPIAAGRHLVYKSLAQIPAHRNRPVSFDVSHHKRHTMPYSALSKFRPSEIYVRFGQRNTRTAESARFRLRL